MRRPQGVSTKTAVLVSTRNRRDSLSRWFEAMAQTTADHIIVVDNNDEPDQFWIVQEARKHGLEIVYRYCSVPGYASPRNMALITAIDVGATVFIFVDDDNEPLGDFVEKHLEAMTFHQADVIAAHRTTVREGKPAKTAVTRNVSMKRWIAERGVRFDERLNLTGSEDVEFFYDAARAGAKIVYSMKPRVSGHVQPKRIKASIQNRVFVARTHRGFWAGACRFLVALASLDATVYRHAWRGLWIGGLDRRALARGELIEVPYALPD